MLIGYNHENEAITNTAESNLIVEGVKRALALVSEFQPLFTGLFLFLVVFWVGFCVCVCVCWCSSSFLGGVFAVFWGVGR